MSVHFKASLLGLALLGCQGQAAPPRAELAGPLRTKGSATLVPFIQGAGVAFHAQHAQVQPVVDEARSSAAIKDLADGNADLAFTSRPLRASDRDLVKKGGKPLHMVVIGAEAVVVMVHPSNPLADVSVEQLRGIFFTGALTDWSTLTHGAKSGPIKAYAVNPKTSGTGELFTNMVTKDDKAVYAPRTVLIDYSDATVAKVASDENAISFSGMGNVNATVRVVTFGGVAPTEKTILDTSYALNRKLFAVTLGPPRGAGREFIKFLLSEEGQTIGRQKGVTPIALD